MTGGYMGDPFDGVVTAVTVYGKVAEVSERVLELTHRVGSVDDKVSGMVTRLDDHEARLRTIEAGRWPKAKIALLLTACGLVIALAGLIIGLIVKGLP